VSRTQGRTPAPIVVGRREEAEVALAREIAALVRERRRVVLGLATGDTPSGVYRELARMRKVEGIDFGEVVTFNLDEYLDLAPGDLRSFDRWTRECVGLPLGIAPARSRAPGGGGDGIAERCRAYEEAIREAGGVDLQILGIGRNGHVAFNEPGSARASRTREVELHAWTREDAAERFGGIASVPRRAVTMGVATILEARALRVLAFGVRKRAIVKLALEGPVGPEVPATFLRGHPDLVVRLDREAAGS
jgi:glucosamine-6-phosphate deaminase